MPPPTLALETVSLDRHGATPLHRQLFDALRQAILAGRLKPGTRLPSTRVLASQLGVARNTVMAAFDQLVAEGYLQARVGSGTRVSAIAPDSLLSVGATGGASVKIKASELSLSARGRLLAGTARPLPSPARAAFQPGLPALDEFPFAIWSRLLARHARRGTRELLGYGHVGGYPKLRQAIADYLVGARGVDCAPEQVIVVTGAQAALDLVARMLLDPGDRVWLEEPGYLGARGALLGAGARLCPVPVDPDGLEVSVGEREFPDAKLVYVTPSFQYPLGVTMSLERRLRLIEWAHRANAWIIEDDYDSEYRYRGRPLSALQGLDSGERVLYVGTFSKTMFPGLRLAYVVVPRGLVTAFRRALRHTGQDAPLGVQAALADFVREGHYSSHLRRMRALYAARQRRFIELITEAGDGLLELGPADAGMQLAAYLPALVSDRDIARRAEDAGLATAALSSFYLGKCPRPGLLLGYAGVPEADMAAGVDALARVLPFEEPRRAAG